MHGMNARQIKFGKFLDAKDTIFGQIKLYIPQSTCVNYAPVPRKATSSGYLTVEH